jgi:hypothetical protein
MLGYAPILRRARTRAIAGANPTYAALPLFIQIPGLNATVGSMKDRQPRLLRFVLLRPHPDTGVAAGILTAAYQLCEGETLVAWDRRMLEHLLAWFETNLATPSRFNRTKSKGHYRRKTKGISWLKSTASEHIDKMRTVSTILEENGYRVSQIETRRPGYVVFEDDHQVVAEPFAEERK